MSVTGASPHTDGIIEVKLRELGQLFNSLDPTPFPEKDLDADAEEFIVSWAMEIPKNMPLTLRVHLATQPVIEDATATIEHAVHTYFDHRAQMMRFKLRQLLTRGRWSLLIGILFLAACLGAADLIYTIFGEAAIFKIIKESLVIGGWVAMWRPMEIFLYDWWPLRHEKRIFTRLITARIDVVVAKPA